jgi:integrase
MLTAKRVERTKKPGRYACGLIPGLLLQIAKSGTKSWVLRYERDGKEHWLGLGSARIFNLKEARERARRELQLLADGVDPLAAKHAARRAANLAAAKALTFREAAQRYFDQHESKWTNAIHRKQFLSTLGLYAFPVLGDMDVSQITVADVLRALEPHWRDKAVSADRTRARVESVLDWCVVRGHRLPGVNPAKWKSVLDQVLPPPRKVAPVVHHKALDYSQLPALMAELRQLEGTVARALEFLILTATRTAEVLGATWPEVDLDNARWEIPPERMKNRKPHSVPLSPSAVALLRQLPREPGNPHVFIGRPGRGLPKMALFNLQRERLAGADGATVHGHRAAFSTYCYEQTSHANHTIELALAHSVGNEAERAYRRSSMYDKRRKLMAQWATFCETPPAKDAGRVVPLRNA